MAQLRISDLPKVTTVGLEDYLLINSGNTITSTIAVTNYSQSIIELIEQNGLLPENDVDGGNIVAPIYEIIDGGTPTTPGAPVGVVFNGGTPVDPGYGPSADGGYVTA